MDQFFSSLLLLVIFIFIVGICRALYMSKKSVTLIAKYQHDKHNPKLIEEIWSAVSKDWWLGSVIEKNHATQEDILQIHQKLMKWGDFRKYNRYIPITAFFNRTALKYLLEHKNDSAKSLTQKMFNLFHIWRDGKIKRWKDGKLNTKSLSIFPSNFPSCFTYRKVI